MFGFFNKSGVWTGMMSESQFLLEGVALAALVALIWPIASHHTRER